MKAGGAFGSNARTAPRGPRCRQTILETPRPPALETSCPWWLQEIRQPTRGTFRLLDRIPIRPPSGDKQGVTFNGNRRARERLAKRLRLYCIDAVR
jgi:hypothetical protein